MPPTEALAGLTAAVEGEVRLSEHDRLLYATDASLYQVEPIAVVIPASIDDAVRAVEYCAAHGLPMLPRGGGTSLAGQCTNRAVVLDLSARCRGVAEIDAGARRCRVEPGVVIDDLNQRLAGAGLFFAPDPATVRQACVGGCIGNNAAGARSIRYGRTSESVAAIDALVVSDPAGPPWRARLSRGAARGDARVRDLTRRVATIVAGHDRLIRDRFPKTLRRNAGYALDAILSQMDSAGARADADAIVDAIDLCPLLCGSEGTLAVTLGAELTLHPLPAAKGLAVLAFESVDAAVEAVGAILETGPVAVELLDDLVIGLAAANTEYRRYVDLLPRSSEGGPPRAVLYVEYFADRSVDELAGLFDRLRTAVPGAPMVTLTDPARAAPLWALRRAGEPLLHGLPGRRKPVTFIEDNAVPVEHLPRFVRELRAIVERHGTRAAFWAHASVGVLHVRPLLDLRDPDDERRLHAIAVEAADLARSLGGVMSGEHGDGRVRGPLLERFFGPDLMRAFRQVKAVFDPRGLLNPGNIVSPGPVESITQGTRLRPADRGSGPAEFPAVETYYDYADQHGFSGAVEMCNGAGVCRKNSGGVMCPSYMATRDERHATRGRGNALRLAITGQVGGGALSRPAWNDPEALSTLDLCLSCKACKAECPSNVDIARLKAEYLAQGYRHAGATPLAALAFGHVRALNRAGAMAPGLANWAASRRWARRLIDPVLGLAPRRSLPEFARPLTAAGVRDAARAASGGRPDSGAPRVLLFADCFTTYNEPRIGLAAARVLGRLGYRVELANAGCCGRAMISTGLLPAAIDAADVALGRLRAAAEDPSVRAIVVCEPSCLSAITDDWMSLRLAAPLAVRRALASKAELPEDFIERDWARHPRAPATSATRERAGAAASVTEGEILFHGHCHQRTLCGPESGVALLRRLAGQRVRVAEAGCCGMAGSFGYQAAKYDLSMRIGELALFPAVRTALEEGRAASRPAIIAAGGTSCRHQIRDGTGARAVHPIELADELMAAAARPRR